MNPNRTDSAAGISRATALALGGSEVSVTSPSGLLAAINANVGTGRTLVLDPGKVFTLDQTALSVAKNHGFHIRGSGTGLLDTSNAQTYAALTADQSVIQLTAVDSAINTHYFQDTVWEGVVFDNSVVTANNKHFFWGQNNTRNYLYRTSILNPSFAWSLLHGDNLIVEDHRITTASDFAGTPLGSWIAPVGLQATRWIVDGNLGTSGNVSQIGVNIYGANISGVTFRRWTFRDCSFFPSGSFGMDAGIDSEFEGATAGPIMEVIGGEMWNSKIYYDNLPLLSLSNGFTHRTTSISGTSGIGGPMLVDGAAAGNRVVGRIVTDSSVLDWSDDAATLSGAISFQMTKTNYIQDLVLRHRIISNGASTNANNVPIRIVSNGGAAQFADNIDIDCSVEYTSAPATPNNTVQIGAGGSANCGKARVFITYPQARTAASGLPTTSVAAVCTMPVQLGVAAKTNTFADIEVGVDAQALTSFGSGGPTAATPQMYGTAGTVTSTRMFYGTRNKLGLAAQAPFGGLFNSLKANSSLVTSGNGLNYTPLSDGYFEAGGNVAIVTLGSASISKRVSFTDENNTAQASNILGTTNPATGTAPAGGTATTAKNWGYDSYFFWAKGGTAINVFDGGTTATSYDSTFFIRQIA